MGYTIIAPVGDNPKALFVGMKQFPTENVVLISQKKDLSVANDLSKKLDEFTIKTKIIEIGDNVLEEMFRVFGELCSINEPEDMVVNVATGDRINSCAALSAAFANGLKAFGVMGDKCMLLPIMRLSYYHELSDNKLNILKEMQREDYISLQDLTSKLSAAKIKMSISLLSYHINGNYKYKGLKSLRLVETKEQNKKVYVKLSELGSLLLNGYIKQKQ